MFKKLKKWFYDLGQALFWLPIRNGNGKVLNSEFAQYMTVWVSIYMIVMEGLVEGAQYTDSQFIGVLTLLAGIIGIKEYFDNKPSKDNNKDQSKNDDSAIF